MKGSERNGERERNISFYFYCLLNLVYFRMVEVLILNFGLLFVSVGVLGYFFLFLSIFFFCVVGIRVVMWDVVSEEFSLGRVDEFELLVFGIFCVVGNIF